MSVCLSVLPAVLCAAMPHQSPRQRYPVLSSLNLLFIFCCLKSNRCNYSDCVDDVQLEAQLIALLIQNMERLDESIKEEADGIHNSLGKLVYCYIAS